MPHFADRYELGPVIGQGGMAEVRGGRDTRLDRPVAVKIMRPEMAHQALVRERFESEAKLAARLLHPNVVSVFDSGEYDGVPFIVMERLPGDTLHDRLAGGPMPEPEVHLLATEVLAALETAHGAGVLHRDIKPANVLSTGTGHWKVGDFGIAKALEGDSGDATATGLILGTPSYLAPERLVGSPATVASDIYAVGVILYEALTGRRPYDTGSSEGWPAIAPQAPLVPLATMRPGVDPALAGAVERALAREPSERFWSAAEMSAAIGGAAVPVPSAAPTEVLSAGPRTEVLPGPAPLATEVLTGTTVDRPSRHPATRLLAALAAAAVLTAIILAVVTTGHGGSPATSRNTRSVITAASTTASTASTTTTTTTVAVTAPPPAPGPGPGPGPGGKKKHH